MQNIQCPNCGAQVEIKNPGITMLACPMCQSTLYWDENAILQKGVKAVLPPGDSRFWLGCKGTLRTVPFEVLGRIRFQYRLGFWDEWFIKYGAKYAWIGEDGRVLSLRSIAELPANLPNRKFLGQNLCFNKCTFSIREADAATCHSFEGELPWAVMPGEKMEYYDCASRDGENFAILSSNPRGQQRLTIGQIISHDDLKIDESGHLAAQYENSLDGQALQCAQCGAALPPAVSADIITCVCPQCGSPNQLFDGQAKIFGEKQTGDFSAVFHFSIGQEATFNGVKYQICGRQQNRFFEYDEGSYCPGGYAQLYLLYNPEKGYKYLEHEDGHFVLLEVTHRTPNNGDAQRWFNFEEGNVCEVGSTTYRVDCRGYSQIIYVDGSFPWLAASGEKSDNIDCWHGDSFYGIERTETEIEFYSGKKLPQSEVLNAFGLESLPKREVDNSFDWNFLLLMAMIALICLGVIAFPIVIIVLAIRYESPADVVASAKTTIANYQTINSDFVENIENPWQLANENKYFNTDYVSENSAAVQNVRILLDGSSATINSINGYLADTNPESHKSELKELRDNLKNDIQTIENSKSALAIQLGEQFATYTQAVKNINIWQKATPVRAIYPSVVAGYTDDWPQHKAALELEQTESAEAADTAEAGRQKVLALNISDIGQINITNIAEFNAAMANYLSLYDNFKALNEKLSADLMGLGEVQETILTDLTKTTAEYIQVNVRKRDGQLLITSKNWTENITAPDFEVLKKWLGFTIKGKPADELASAAVKETHAAGFFVLPHADGPADELIGQWADNNDFTFTDKAADLRRLLWNGCQESMDKKYYAAAGTEDLLLLPVAAKIWQNKCYANSQLVKNNRYEPRSSSGGVRHRSSSGSRSHGGK